MIAQLLAVALDVNIAAGAVDDRFLCCPAEAGEWKPKTLLFVPATSVALNGTNYMTVTVYGADGTTAIASFNTNTGGTALTAGTPVSLSLTAGLNLEFTAGTDSMKIGKAETGSGAALDGAWQVLWERVS